MLRLARPLTVAHDYFTQRGGAERVAAALVNELGPDRVVTAVLQPAQSFELHTLQPVETSFLQQFARFRADPRAALLALPLAWRLARPVTSGVVFCSSSGWSHGIRTAGSATKIVYCHNPARWLYQPEDFFLDQPRLVHAIMRLVSPLLKLWDRRAARSAHLYIANSTAVARRIANVYGFDAPVVHPPVTIDADQPEAPVEGLPDRFFLSVGRGRGYKNLDPLLEAFERLPGEHLAVVGGRNGGTANVSMLGRVTDEQLRWLYRRATALVSVSHEDFGLTPLEANVFGTPALLLRAGGFLDSLDEHVSGEFIENTSADAIVDAVMRFPREWDRQQIVRHAERFSLESFVQQLAVAMATMPRAELDAVVADPRAAT